MQNHPSRPYARLPLCAGIIIGTCFLIVYLSLRIVSATLAERFYGIAKTSIQVGATRVNEREYVSFIKAQGYVPVNKDAAEMLSQLYLEASMSRIRILEMFSLAIVAICVVVQVCLITGMIVRRRRYGKPPK